MTAVDERLVALSDADRPRRIGRSIRLQVERDEALVPVQVLVVEAREACVGAVRARGDLDDLGAEVCEHAARRWVQLGLS